MSKLILRTLPENWEFCAGMAKELIDHKAAGFASALRGEFFTQRNKSGSITIIQTKDDAGKSVYRRS